MISRGIGLALRYSARHNTVKPNVRVDIHGLKRFTLEKLSSRPLLREIILSEEDSLEPSEFVTKMQIWLKLFSAKSRM